MFKYRTHRAFSSFLLLFLVPAAVVLQGCGNAGGPEASGNELAANLGPSGKADDPSGAASEGGVNAPSPDGLIHVQVLAFNDFHGALEPPQGSSGRVLAPRPDPQAGETGTPVTGRAAGPQQEILAGGAAYLATHLQNLRDKNPNTVVVSAGDLLGASPLMSSLFRDEPIILAMNRIGLDYSAIGNHEFDRGLDEIVRLQKGGCNPTDGCYTNVPFPGASFRYLASNITSARQENTGFLPYAIRNVAGAKIAFIGLSLEGTPKLVAPTSVAGLHFESEVEAANALVPELKKQGIGAIVALLHQGGAQTGTYNECVGLAGDIVPIVEALDPAIDVVLSSHTHFAYNCTLQGRLLTSAASAGRIITDIDIAIDPQTKRVVTKAANNVIVTRDVQGDAQIQSIIDQYKSLAAPLANKVISHTPSPISKVPNAAGESAMGNLLADAHLAATAPTDLGGAVIAFVNPGGIRSDLSTTPTGEITYAAAFTVQPFGNTLATMTVSGDQIHTLLEQQFSGPQPNMLAVSKGFTYTWLKDAAQGNHVPPKSIKLNGVTIDPNASYRITANSFLAGGGDRFEILKQGRDVLGGALDLDALGLYLKAHDPLSPPQTDRVIVQ